MRLQPSLQVCNILFLLGDDLLGELPLFCILAVLQFNLGHLNTGLVMRDHASSEVGVGIARETLWRIHHHLHVDSLELPDRLGVGGVGHHGLHRSLHVHLGRGLAVCAPHERNANRG